MGAHEYRARLRQGAGVPGLTITAVPASDLARGARAVLDANRRGDWTCPSATLYPHQWLWDSCFVAVGLARYDPPRAAGELRALFRGQWADGMLPHMVFADDVEDVGSARLWQSHDNPLAPRDVATSCITQPPVPAVALARVADALPAAERDTLLRELVPKVIAYHEWLYRERDPDETGLVTLIHPWECGLDTTPPWMLALSQMPAPWWARAATTLHLAHLVRVFRRDTKYVPTVQRPTDAEGLRMLVLARLGRRYGFDLRKMPRDRAVLIEDLAFNSILAAANRVLVRLAADLGTPVPAALAGRFERTEAAFEVLWDDERGQYFSRDAVTGSLLRLPTVATFLPLFGGVVPPDRAARLVANLREPSGFWPRYPVPTVPTDAPGFHEEAYWKGPTWVNTNWFLVEALDADGHADLAHELTERTLALVGESGFFEYFSPFTGRGYGAREFSWTAALAIDLLARRGG
ncbi:MAG TPA: trehalase family glycosidase [Acidimicrobiia bacterium]|nr:trehalase family glycosidase [Acidimicrobiia bacterium]